MGQILVIIQGLGWSAFTAGKRDSKEGLLVYGDNSDSNDHLGDIFFFTPCLDADET